MGLEHVLNLALAIVILPTIYRWITEWFDKRKKAREKSEAHLQNAKALGLLIELMTTFQQDQGKVYFAVKEIHEAIEMMLKTGEVTVEIEKKAHKIKGAIDEMVRENQSTVANIATLSGHMTDNKEVSDKIKEDTGALRAIAMLPKQ